MKKGKVLAFYKKEEKTRIEEVSGYRYFWHGHPFAVYKLGNMWCILEATTGAAILNCKRLKDVYDTMADNSKIVTSTINLVNGKLSNIGIDEIKKAQRMIREYAVKNYIKEDF